jgi:serine/threonine protein kinase
VFKGRWNGAPVALKKLKSAEHLASFEREAALLKSLSNHPHVLQYLGIHINEAGERFIVTEFMTKGSVSSVMSKEGKRMTTEDEISIAYQAALGLAHISESNVIHRDIGLRNLLLQQKDDYRYFVKVADFGLCRTLEGQSDYYIAADAQVPIKWTAPEALKSSKFSKKSDVWSYGVLLWELFSGEIPYYQFTNSETIEKVVQGYRLPVPENTPPEIGELMKRCWAADPSDRPSFKKIAAELEKLAPKPTKPEEEEHSDSSHSDSTSQHNYEPLASVYSRTPHEKRYHTITAPENKEENKEKTDTPEL